MNREVGNGGSHLRTKREGWGTHCWTWDRQPLLGDQFEDDASAVVEYVHFSGGVLAER